MASSISLIGTPSASAQLRRQEGQCPLDQEQLGSLRYPSGLRQRHRPRHRHPPNYTDIEPLPAIPAKWSYRAIYTEDAQRVGQWSNVAEITVGG